MRRLIRRLSRGRVLKKRLPRDLGGRTVFCSPEVMLSMWKPGWRSVQARHLFDWARRYVQPGFVIWDWGANQGLFSFAAAARAGSEGKIFAFEPDLFLCGLLERSMGARDRHAEVQVLPVAISTKCEIAAFDIAATDRALNHLTWTAGNPRAGAARYRRDVAAVSPDWLLGQLPPPDLVKVDVEGAERAVLESAEKLLDKVRPAFLLETAVENAAPLSALLRDRGYRFYDPGNGRTEWERLGWNTLVLPVEDRGRESGPEPW